ncbi:MAG: hypothetical protein M0R20_02135 [Candidatus Omnitrophica bacterium]|jgi:hypothetical protein|nr:hypothetical protein [Candidatus Omnitrophota bacterium]
MEKTIVRLSGIYVACVGIVVSIIMTLGLLSRGNLTKNQPFLGAVIVYSLLLVLWPVATGLGIIFKKNWARYSIFVMSVFAIFIGISSAVSLIFIPQSVYDAQAKPANYIPEFFISVANFIFFICIPMYFMIFFNKGVVKKIFGVVKPQVTNKKRPLGITLISILSFFTALSSAIFIFMPVDPKAPLIGGLFITGTGEKIYFLVVSVINLYISIGFLRMKKSAWTAYIVFYIVSITIGIVNSFTASKMTFFEIVPSIQSSYDAMPNILYKFSGVIGLILPTFVLMYVVSKKRLFDAHK